MNLTPSAIQQFFTNDGDPAAGYKIFTYAAGTTTKIATYTDSSGSLNTNPIILNFRGEARIWLDPTLSYKFTFAPSTDTDPPTSGIWTVDNITAGPANRDNAAQDTGSANTARLSIPALSGTPSLFDRIVWKSAFQNTGSVSIVINGGLTKTLTWQNFGSLQPSTIATGGIYEAIYDGTQWQLQGPTLNPTELRTAAEIAAGVTPTYYGYLPGDVRRYGAVGDGTTNCQTAFDNALLANTELWVPTGTWVVDHWTINRGCEVHTAGFDTIFTQRQDLGNLNRRVIEIRSSNVVFGLEGFKVSGGINFFTGEQQHGVIVQGVGASINNIIVGNVTGQDIRGDVLYMGAPATFSTTAVQFGQVIGTNIYRNVVSIVGACQINGIGVWTNGNGYATLDIEPDNVPSTDVYVGWIRGGVLQVAPSAASMLAQRIRFGLVDLNPAYQPNSSPGYSEGGSNYANQIKNALILRNTVGLKIDYLKVRDHTEFAVKYIFNGGEVLGRAIHFGYIDISGVGSGESVMNAAMNAAAIESMTIDDGEVSLLSVGDSLIFGDSSAKNTAVIISRLKINGTVQRFGKNCRYSQIIRNDVNDSYTFRDIDGLTITDSNITATKLFTNITAAVVSSTASTCTTYFNGVCTNIQFLACSGGLASVLRGSATYDPPSLADGAGVTTTITATGLVGGDFVTGFGFSTNLVGVLLTAYTVGTDAIGYRFQNETGGVVDLASGTLIGTGAKA